MFKRIFLTLAAASMCMLGACNHEVPYNSNSGSDGSRDAATQLFIGQNHVDDVSAPVGDNEDWFYFVPTEDGTIEILVNVDTPQRGAVIVSLLDRMGRTIEECSSENANGICQFRPLNIQNVEQDQDVRYFIAVRTLNGISPYTINIGFQPPSAPIEIVEDQTPTPPPVEPSCVPAKKCKAGQKCCKEKAPATPNDPPQPPPQPDDSKPSATGTIVLVTPRSGDVSDIKINGINKNNAKPGVKAYLRGLKRKVDIYSCLNTSCQATIKATPEELANHDKVDVYSE